MKIAASFLLLISFYYATAQNYSDEFIYDIYSYQFKDVGVIEDPITLEKKLLFLLSEESINTPESSKIFCGDEEVTDPFIFPCSRIKTRQNKWATVESLPHRCQITLTPI